MNSAIKRSIQKQQTYQRILDVAYQEFSAKGLLATTTNDIAQSVGIAHGTLFIHFATREDLLLQVIQAFGSKIGKRLQLLMHNKRSLKEVLEVHLALLQECEPFWAHLIRETAFLSVQIQNSIILLQSGIAHYIEQAYMQESKSQKLGQFPLHIVLNTWLGLIYYYLANRDIFAPGKSVLETHGKELTDNFMKMITVK